MADRVVVLRLGRKVAESDRKDTSMDQVVSWITAAARRLNYAPSEAISMQENGANLKVDRADGSRLTQVLVGARLRAIPGRPGDY